jgi:hypothetical protein
MLRFLEAMLRKRVVLALVAGGMVFAAVFAFAAALNITAGNLQAGNQTVGSCDADGISTTYSTTYDSSIPGYKFNGVTVSGIAAGCDGKTVSVTLTGSSNSSLASGSKSFSSAGSNTQVVFASVDLSAQPSAASVTGISAVISG